MCIGKNYGAVPDDRVVWVWDLASGSCLTTLLLPHTAQCLEGTADGIVALGMGSEVLVLALEPAFRRF
jgi:hypothetical protein